MKLIVQIPCYNEEQTLPATVADIPRRIEGVDTVEVLIVDDGSTDGTVEAARRAGVDHIVQHTGNRGLARSFATGLAACLKQGADIIVNTDGDNQYAGASIPDLVRPIVEGRADVVVGDRRTDRIPHFSRMKKWLQRSGSLLVRYLSGLAIPDAVSGFRAYSRDAALRLNVLSDFSYTVESLIQAGRMGLAVTSVPVETNPKTRESRLFRSLPGFLWKQLLTMFRSYTMYRSLRVFATLGLVLLMIGLVPVVRFLIYFLLGQGEGKVQSLILGATFITLGYVTFVSALLADAIAMNRRLLETTIETVRRLDLREAGDGPGRDAAAGPGERRETRPPSPAAVE
ncbi:MAG TPA: glycosyltransferase family 2 protein [Thermohalobaculum sp.]|nr:glycosyltransferase family 2 protein [Thermohalobaculum sp.]